MKTNLRAAIFAAIVGTGLSCDGANSDDFSAGPFEVAIADVTEVALDKAVGPQRAEAWTLDKWDVCSLVTPRAWAPAANNNDYFYESGRRSPTQCDVWQVGANSGIDYTSVAGTNDGGMLAVADNAGELVLAAYHADGTTHWEFRAQGLRGTAIAALPDGGGAVVAIPFTQDTPGSIPGPPDPNVYIIQVGPDGLERVRTPLGPITVPFPGTADPAYYADGASPGRGAPVIETISAAPDGGVAFVGGYAFRRVIECGTEQNDVPADPTPTSSKCGFATATGVVGRIDSAGKLLWSHRTGRPYRDLFPAFRTVAVNADGSVLAAGMLVMTHKTNYPPVQAIVMRFDADGDLQWSKSIPFGAAPGEIFQRGLTRFNTAMPREAGAFDIIFEAPGPNQCRLLRFDAKGEVTRVQLLRPEGLLGPESSLGGCESRATGKALMYVTESGVLQLMAVRLMDD